MTIQEKDKMTSLIWLAAGLAVCYGGIRLSIGRLHEPGPGFFAFLSGSVLALLSLIVFLGTLRPKVDEKNEVLWKNRPNLLKTIYVTVMILTYTIAMNYIGFLVSTFLFLGVSFKILGTRSRLTVAVCSILGGIGSWFIFKYWLGVQLPGGIIGY